MRRLAWMVAAIAVVGCADSAPTEDAPTMDAAAPLSSAPAELPPDGPVVDAGAQSPPSGGCAAAEEVCDGLDDNCDERVDEGCACVGPTACYGGPPETRGVGECQDGGRDCDALGELWNDCRYWIGPGEEVCGDGLDDDCDGQIDEACAEPPPDPPPEGLCDAEETCGDGLDNDCDGQIDEACRPECLAEEICGDGLDNDCDGQIDAACEEECAGDVSRACFPGPPAQIGVGECLAGQQRCAAGNQWGPCEGAVGPAEEVCDDGLDNDCDGRVDDGCLECEPDDLCGDGVDNDCDGEIDEGCDACQPAAELCGNGVDEDCDGADAECGPRDVPIFLVGDCLTARCPPDAPHPVGCTVFFSPGDDRGCVASTPQNPVVYFQAGDQCNRGFVTGTLRCSDEPGAPLGPANCPINKPIPIYPPDPSGCPDVHD